MDFFLILVAVGVISTIISAVAKNKKREEARRQAQAGQRPLSDIQRAAMMAQETASQRPAAPQRPAYTPQQPTVHAPMEARNIAPMEARNIAPMEARNIAPMEARTAAPMEARTAAPMQARTVSAMQPRPMYATPPAANGLPASFYSGSMNAATSEGWSDNTDDDKPMELLRASEVESVADVDLETKAGSRSSQPTRSAASQQMPLRLFDGKNEYVKAVIYAEVLKRRSPGRRVGRA